MLGGLQTTGQYHVTRARRVGRSLKAPGFTVIEVMIVLAVTGLLFISSAALISGRQNRTAFDQAVHQVQSQLQQVINEVSIGYYPNMNNVQCSGVGATVSLTKTSGTVQGTNAGCVFTGKAVQFGVSGSDPEQFKVYSLAGLQKGGAGGLESRSLAEAKPKVIAPTATNGNLPDVTNTETLQNGLTASRMWYNDAAGDRQIGIVAFTTSFASFDSSTGAIMSGSQRVDVVPIDDGNSSSKIGASALNGVGVINSNIALPATITNPANGVYICFTSGTTNQSGLVTIGNKNRQLSVKLDIKNGKTC